jgi:hypothetical protein
MVEAAFAQTLADRHEDVGTRREIEHADPLRRGADRGREFVPAGVLARIERVVGNQFEKTLQGRFGQIVAERLDHRRAYAGMVFGFAERIARNADQAAAGLDLAVGKAVIQRGQQLAHGEIAGAAENDEIEGVDLAGGCSHGTLLARSQKQYH